MTIKDLPENEQATAMLAGMDSDDGCAVLIKKGEELHFYSNGQLAMRIQKKDNKIYGKVEMYWDNGKLKEIFSVKNRIKEGNFERRFKNGKVKMVGTYKKDKLNDEIKEWYGNGQIKAHYFMDDGRPIGEGKHFARVGKVEAHWFWAKEEDGTFISIPINKARRNFPEGPWLK